MKTKRFDCVEMKRHGAEKIYQAIATLSNEQQLDYWKRGSNALRKAMQEAGRDKATQKRHG